MKDVKCIYLLLLFLFIGLFFILRFVPFEGWVDDCFNISNNDSIENYMSVIISSIISLLGVIFAILLLTFEFYRNKFGRIGSVFFSGNIWLATMLSLIIGSLILAELTYISIPKSVPFSSNITTLLYLNFILFLVLVPLVLYMTYQIFSKLNIFDIVNRLISEIDINSILLVDANFVIYTQSTDKKEKSDKFHVVKRIDSDPLFILQRVCVNYFKANDSMLPQIIIKEMVELFSSHIKQCINENTEKSVELQQRFACFLISILKNEVDSYPNPLGTFRVVMKDSIKFIELSLVGNKKIVHLESFLSFFLKEIYAQLIDMDNIMKVAFLKKLKELIHFLIKNSPPNVEKIEMFSMAYKKKHGKSYNWNVDLEDTHSWNIIERDLFEYFFDTVKIAEANRDGELLKNTIKILEFTVIKWSIKDKFLDALVDETLTMKHFMFICKRTIVAIDKEIMPTSEYKRLMRLIQDFFETKKMYKLESLKYLLLVSFSDNYLNYSLQKTKIRYIIRELFSFGYFLAHIMDNEDNADKGLKILLQRISVYLKDNATEVKEFYIEPCIPIIINIRNKCLVTRSEEKNNLLNELRLIEKIGI